MTKVVLVNQTRSVLTDDEVAAVVPVLQTLFDRDFEPVWGTALAVRVSSIPTGAEVPIDCWPIYLQDTTDQPGAGGYHEDQGLPFGKVFARDAMEANESWTVDLTHEFLEMCGDPTTQVLIDLPQMAGFACLREVGDAVEEDTLGYQIDGVLVTDWCTPEYFYQKPADGGPIVPRPGTRLAGLTPRGLYDFMGHINAPAPALLHGGYLGIRYPDGEWGSVNMFKRDGRQSRRSMRTHGRLNRKAAGSLR